MGLALLLLAVLPKLHAQTGAPGGVATGLVAWQKADDGSSTNALWEDSSGNNNDAAQATAGSRPILRSGSSPEGVNFNPAFDFDGTNDFFQYTSALGIGGTANASSVIAFRGDASTQAVLLGDPNTGTNQFMLLWNVGPFAVGVGGGPATCNFTTTTTSPLGFAGIGSAVRGSSNMTVALNGGGAASGACATNFTSEVRRLGARNGNYTNGVIPEFIEYNRALTATELQRVQSYLAVKYGVSLDQATPRDYLASDASVIWNATANATYKNGITGIGRDDDSALIQRQSKQSTPSSTLTIGLGGIAADNTSNPNNFPADKSFLIWGQDAGSLTQLVPVPSTSLTRLGRVWKVQETGTVGDVLVRIRSTILAGQTPALVRSANATFGSGNTVVPMTLNGENYEGTTDFADGDFFTFASVLAVPGGVANASLWLRGDVGMDCAANGCAATEWQDQSGSAKHADTVVGTLSRVNAGANFNPTMAFDAGDGMRGPSLMGTGTYSNANVYIVSKRTTANGNSDFFEFGNPTANRIGVYQPATDNIVYWDGGSSATSNRLTAPAGTITTNVLELKTYNASTTAGQTLGGTIRQGIVLNGKAITTDTTMASFSGDNRPYNLGGLSLDFNNAATATLGGEEFAEVIVFTSAITAAQQRQIHSYLALKYGITLDQTAATNYVASDGSVVWNATTNATYKNNIAGIGRDDTSGLNQKQSQSINTASSGNFVTMGLGTIAVDNASNANAFAADRNFLIWGNDAGNLAQTTVVSGAAPGTKRFTRVWKMQETGTVGAVLVRIPTAQLRGAQPVLIRSTDATFDGSDTLVPLSLNGASYEATTDFGSSDFFTFAAVVGDPGGVSGAALWVKANAGLAVNGSSQVEQWFDQSGSGNTVSELRASAPAHNSAIAASASIVQVANAINFNPAADFSGASGKTLKGSAAANWNATPVSIFAVSLPEGAPGAGYGGIFDALADWTANDTTAAGIGVAWNGANYLLDGSGCLGAVGTSAPSGVRLARGIYTSGTNGNGSNVWVDGLLEATSATSCATNATTFFELGGRTAGSATFDTRVFNGKIAEVVVYRSNIAAANANKVESYLAIKYGITLRQTPTAKNYFDSGGSVVWDATPNATYRNNITGIGRDDLSTLDQRQSRSVNTANNGNLVTIGLGTIAADNASNANAFAADRRFMIWGDDAAPIALSTAVTGTGGVRRMTRVWKVQETGVVGSVLVRVPSSSLPGTSPVLIRSVDTTFTSADTILPLTLNGASYEATIDYATGDFFTFGAVAGPGPGGVGGTSLWLRGDQGMSCTTDSCTVTQWQDVSGNTKHANVVTGPLNRQNVAVNFNPALKFAIGKRMNGASLLGTGTYSNANVYIVSKKNTVNAQDADFYEINTTGNPTGGGLGVLEPWYTDNIVYWDAGTNGATDARRLTAPAGTLTLGQYELKSYNASTTTGQTIASVNQAISLNGRVRTSDATMATFTGNNGVYNLGAYVHPNGTVYANQAEDIAEVVVTTNAITPAEQLQINSYLALKYGVTLLSTAGGAQDYASSQGLTTWNGAANSAYHNDVAGIGRDDASALNQKQSASINAGNLVTIGRGAIAADNLSNPNNFTADQSFLVWGRDTGAVNQNVAIATSSVTRMARIWRAQETGSVGPVVVRIPASAISGTQPVLIRSTDATFTSTDTFAPLTLNGANYEATVDFGPIEFFTFGAVLATPGGVGANLQLWLRADVGAIVTGTNVSTWEDQSGLGRDATAPAARQPVFQASPLNFNPGLRFIDDTNPDFMSVGNNLGLSGTNPFTLFGATSRTPGDYHAIIGQPVTSVSTNTLVWGYTVANQAWIGATNVSSVVGTAAYTTNTPRIIATTRGNGGANVFNHYNNGGVDGGGTAAYTFTTEPAQIGSRGTGDMFDGTMGDVIVFSRTLTATELLQVSSYLAIKYGITLDQTTPRNYLASDGTTVTWGAATNTIYKNNIAGIGRDDTTGLVQRQSKSVNPGEFVTIGLSTIAADNVSNPNTFAADKSFTIWGHDNASSVWGTTVSGSTLRRMARVWKVQETGTVGGVLVRIPRTVLGGTSPTLLRSVDPTFDNTDTQVPMTLNGAYFEAPIDFATGDYFTFASADAPAVQSYGDGYVYDGTAKAPIAASTPVCHAPQFWEHLPVKQQGILTGGNLNQVHSGLTDAAESTFLADVNNDGKLDLLAVWDSGGTVATNGTYVWLGNGDGTFQTTAIRDTGTFNGGPLFPSYAPFGGASNNESTFVADVNSDGSVDIVWFWDSNGNAPNSGTWVWLGNGDGTFQHTPIVDHGLTGGTEFAFFPVGGFTASETANVVDVNNDGKLDIVWAFDHANANDSRNGVWAWLGNGDGTWQHTPILSQGLQGGTGFTYTPAGGVTSIPAGGVSWGNESTHFVDIDKDGFVDLVWVFDAGNANTPAGANSGVRWWKGLGNGQFETTVHQDLGFQGGPGFAFGPAGGQGPYETTRIVDVNRDGNLDILWIHDGVGAPGTSGTYVYLGNGNGTFNHTPLVDVGAFGDATNVPDIIQAGFSPSEITLVGDVNGDGVPDIFWGWEGTSFATSGTWVWLGNDTDEDGQADIVDSDDDNDGVADAADTCAGPGSVASGMQLWLKADKDLTVDGLNNAIHWADQTANNRDANLVTGDPAKVTAGVNFNPTVQFDGNDYFNFGKAGFTAAYTSGETFVVVKDLSPASGNHGNPFDFGGGSQSLYTWSDGNIYLDFGTTDRFGWNPITKAIVDAHPGVTSVAGPSINTGTYHLYGVHAATNDWGVRFDGTTAVATASNVVSFADTGGAEAIGATTGYPFDGEVAEAILYNRTLTTLEREQVQSYLATKYGITLGHSYRASDDTTIYWDMAANAAYHNDVAGIGFDDGATLNQKQSGSINPGNIVWIGLGGIAATNQTNPNTFGADRTFMMWGHDNASVAQSILVPGTSPRLSRVARVWKVQETGTVDSVVVRVPMTALRGTSPTMIVSADPTFDNTDTLIPMFDVGSNYEAAVDLANGQYFTFASYAPAPGGVTLNLAHWAKADGDVFEDFAATTPTTPGGLAGRWNDMSGNGVHAKSSSNGGVADDANKRPTLVAGSGEFNFNPSISFAGNKNFAYNAKVFDVTDDGTLFSVARWAAQSGYQSWYGFGPVGNDPGFHILNNTSFLLYDDTSSPVGIAYPTSVATSTSYLFGADWAFGVANDARLSLNGNRQATTGEIPTNAERDDRMVIGNDGAAGEPFNGSVPEVIAYDRRLTLAEQQRVNSYLAIKYGLTLLAPGGTPQDYLTSAGTTIWSGVSNVLHHHDVAGITNDTASALDQRVSRSVNVGDQVTIAAGAYDFVDPITAQAPTEAIGDQSALVWGHNDLGATMNVAVTDPTITATGVSRRMPRVWRTQVTGTGLPAQLSILIPATLVELANPDVDAGSVRLLISPTQDFSAGSRAPIVLTKIGAVYTAGFVTFVPGEYFTFAATDSLPPTTTITLAPPTPDGANGWWISPVTVTVAATDPAPGSGVTEIRCVLDPVDVPTDFSELPTAGCAYTGAAAPVSTNGTHTVYAAAIDNAGNTSTVVSATFKIDQELPVTTIALGPASPNGTGGWYTTPVQVTISATDDVSGVDTIRCVLDPASVPTTWADLPAGSCAYTGAGASVSAPGTHTIYSATIDAAGNVSSIVSTSFNIASAIDLSLTKSVSPATAVLNDVVTFTVTVTNPSATAAPGVVVNDVLPAGFTLDTPTPSQGTYVGASGEWAVGTLPATQSATLTLTARVTQTGTLTNLAAIKARDDRFDPDSSNNTAEATVNASTSADLAVVKTVDNTAPEVGTNVTFTVTVTNQGPNDANGVAISDAMPVGLSLVTATPSAGTSYTAPTWTVGTLANGAQATLTIVASVDAPGALVNSAVKSAQTEADYNPANDQSSVTLNAAESANIAVAKSTSNAAPAVGESVTFTVIATNHGPSGATGVVIGDVLPVELTFASAVASTGSYDQVSGAWSVGSIPPSGTEILTITATVSAEASVTNTASVSASDQTDSESTNNTASASLGSALVSDLAITKTLTTAPIPGLSAGYTIVVTNNGPSPVTGATVTDTFPAALTGATWTCSADAGSTCATPSGSGNLSTTVDLQSGDAATFLVSGMLAPGATGLLANSATVAVPAGATDPTAANDTATSSVALTPTADIQVAKSGPATITAGTNVTYTITVTNAGPSDAVGVTLDDPTPTGLSFVSNGGDCTTAFPCTLGTLPAGATRTITTTFSVPGGYSGADPIVNAATASSTTTDPSAGNNTAIAQTAIGAAVTDLGITKTNGVTTVVPGATTGYTITVTNAGPSNAIGATVIDTFPTGLTGVTWSCVGASGGACSAPSGSGDINTIVDVPVGGIVTFTATGTVAPDATGVLVNTASVTPPAGASDPSSANNTDADTVTPQADLQITKNGPASIVAGNPLAYTITVTNNGPSNAENVVVADATPAGLTFTSNAGDCATAFPCSLGTVPAGSTRTITATFAVPPDYTAPSPIVNTASVSASTTDPTSGNDSATAQTTLNLDADVEVTKSVSPGSVLVGETVTVTVGVENNGPNPATGVEVTDALPAGFAFVSAAPTQGSYDSATGKWTVGSLAASATAQLVITTTADVPGSITNLAVKTAQAGPDPNVSNDSAGATTNAAPSADVAIDKTVDEATPLVGNTVTFTVTATNRGPNDATNLAIADALPAGLSLVTATPSQGSYAGGVWTVGTLANGNAATLTLAATVDVSGALVNNASVSAQDQADPDPLNNNDAASVNASPNSDLRVTKAVSNAAPGVGEPVTYTIAVTNLGPSAATGAVIEDVLPAGVSFVSATPSQGTYDSASGLWTLGAIPVTGTETLSITVQVNALGALNNTATRQSSSPVDPNASNDSGSASATSQLITDLSVTKTLTTGALPGAPASYTIVVTNNGPSPVTGATVTDTFPAAFTGATWTCTADAGSACAAPSGSGTIATTVDLEAGDQATFTVNGVLAASATGMLSNTATVAVPVGATDPEPANDTSTSNVPLAPVSDLQVTKSGPASVAPGTNVTYTIVVTNAGPSDAAGVSLADPTPSGLSFVSTTGDCTTTFPCALGSIPAGASRTITATFSVPSIYTAPDPIVNTATVSSTTTEGNSANNSSAASTTVAPEANLSLTKTGTATVLPGGTVTYTLTIGNTGPSDASAVTVNDPTPAGLTFVSNTDDCTTAFPCALGTVPVGATRTITATYTVPTNYSGPFPIVNAADVSSAAADPSTPNNAATAQTVVNRDADVEITKSTSPTTVLVGGTVTVTIDVVNHGPNPATAVEVTDNLPAGFQFVSATPTQGTYDAGSGKWSVGTLALSGTAQLVIATTATQPGSIVNVATKTAQAEPDPNPANDSAGAMTNTAAAADVTIDKTVDKSDALVGETVTFIVHALNRGPNNVTGLTIADALPAGLSLVTATPSQGGYAGGVWTVGSVAVGVEATLTLVATVDVPGALVNDASVTGQDQADPNVLNNSDAASVNAAANADLRVTKAVSNAAPGVGEQVTYTIAVTNLGPNDVTTAAISDALPAGVSFASATASQGIYDSGTGVWTLDAIPASVTRTLSIVVTVDDLSAATNTATRQSSSPIDPNPANDGSSASTSPQLISDLSVTKTLITSPIPGLPATYEIVVTNNGPSPVTGATVADTFPAAFTGSSWTCVADAGSLCTVASGAGDIATTVDLESGDAATFTVNGTIPSAATGTLANTVTIGVPAGTIDPDPADNSTTSSVALTPTADVQVAKSGPATTTAGTSFSYTIVVTNAGPSDAVGVSLADPTPAGLTFLSNAGDCTTAFPCALGTIPAGQSRTVTATFDVPPGYTTPDPIVNTATASSTTTDPSSGNNAATAMTALGAAVTDLGITKTNGVTTVVPGSTTTYTITVTNAGPSNAVGATVIDTFPAALTGVTWSCVGAGGGACPSSGSGNINASVDVPVGGSVTFTATGTVSASATGVLVNTASVTPPSGAADPSSANNTDADTVTPQADLDITKTGPASIIAGNPLVYTITVTNNGPSNAENVVVADPTPAGLAFTSNAGDCTTAFPCALGTVPAGATRTITATFAVPPGYTAPSPIVNTATVSSTTSDTTSANDSATAQTLLNRDADVEVTKSTSPASVLVGDTVTVTVGVTNHGPNPATNVEVTDNLPAGFSFVSAAPTQGTYDASSGRWIVGALGVSGSAQLVITTTATSAGSITNLAVKTGQVEPDPNPANDSAGATTNAAAAADVSVDKSVDDATPLVGNTVTFTVRAENRGPNDATGVAVSDALPSGLTLVTATPSQGAYAGGVWTVGSLTSGASSTLAIVATVDAPGALVNNAAVTAQDQADPNPLNNSDAASVNAAANSDLRVTKAISNPTPAVGEQVTYTIAATNLGPSDLTSAEISEMLPAGVLLISSTASQGSYDAFSGVWTLGAIPVSGTETLSITVQITNVGAMANTASRQSSSPIDPNPLNDSGMAGATSSLIADLKVTKTPGTPSASAGAPLTWTIVVTNDGPSPATGAAVMDAMPAGFNGATWTCTASAGSSCGAPSGTGSIATTVTLLPAHSATFAVSGTIDPPASGSLANTVTVTAPSGTTDPDASDNSAAASVSLNVAADVSLAKSVLEPSVLPGQTFTFRLSATNAGPSTATGVSVTDPLPAQLTFVSSPSGCTAVGQTVTCPTLATLNAGATVDFDVFVRLNPSYVGDGSDIDNVATASTTSPDPTSINNSNPPVGPLAGAPSADLSTAKSALETHVTPGGTITYRIVTTNNGPSTAVNVRATDALPAPLTFVSSTSGCTAVGQNVSCGPVASLAPGAAATFDFVVQLDPAYTGNGSNLANVATSESDTSDPNPANNPSPPAAPPILGAPTADLQIVKNVSAAAVTPGTNYSYTLQVRNNGPAVASDVVATDPLPPQAIFVSSSAGCSAALVGSTQIVTCPTIPTLGVGASATFDIVVQLDPAYTGDGSDILNSATVTGAIADPTLPNNTSPAGAPPVGPAGADVTIVKTVSPGTVTPGTTFTYGLLVSNQGPSVATNVVATDTLPAGVTFVSSTQGCTAATSGSSQTVTCPAIATLAPGGYTTFALVVRLDPSYVGSGSDLPNQGSVAADTADPVPANNTSAPVTPAVGPAISDVSISKTALGNGVSPGMMFNYRIVVANNGPSTATGVVVTDTLPGPLTFISAPAFCSAAGQVVTCPLGSLLPGATAVFDLVVRLDPAYVGNGGDIMNTAAVTTTTIDPGPSPNVTPPAAPPPIGTGSADLTVSKVGPAGPPPIGGEIAYTIVITNQGPNSAVDVVVQDPTPAGLTFVGTSGDCTTPFPCALGTLAPGAAKTIVARYFVPAGHSGMIVNTAAATSSTPEQKPSNNSSTAQTPPQALTYYLSEGATGPFFDYDLLIANPNGVPAPITIRFFKESGETFTETRTVPALTRLTIRVDDLPPTVWTSVSVEVISDSGLPLAVERSMFWDPSYYAGHTGTAVPQPATRWYFAEGFQGYFNTFLLLENANASPVDVTVTFLRETQPPVVKTMTIGPFTRRTVDGGSIPEVQNHAFGMVVEATLPIVAERSMYLGSASARPWIGGHSSVGVSEPTWRWFLPEGATGTFFDTFILLSNPQPVDARVMLDFQLPSGDVISSPKVVPAQSRLTVNLEAEADPRLHNASVSTRVTSDVPIVAERSMYWLGKPDAAPWSEGHNSFGITESALQWSLAEGRVGGPLQFHTYILLSNPWESAAEVRVTFLRESGDPVVKTYTVAPTTRFNVNVNSMVPELQNESFGARIEVLNGFTISVERSMYWDSEGTFWNGGTNAPATRIP